MSNHTECEVGSCERAISCKGLCATHYSRYLKHGDPQEHIPIVPKRKVSADGLCGILECGNKTDGHFMCNAHRYRESKFGDPFGGKEPNAPHVPGSQCMEPECEKVARVRGLCGPHYRYWLLNVGETPDIRYDRKQRENFYSKQYKNGIKDTVFGFYGKVCACCGEPNRVFLAIDHINGEGAAHRRAIGSSGGDSIYRWLIKNNLPEGFQTLCHNCNWAKHVLGACPHQGPNEHTI